MIVTVITMGMMQVTINEIINVITMGNRFVPTTRAVLLAATVMIGRTPIGIPQPGPMFPAENIFIAKCLQ